MADTDNWAGPKVTKRTLAAGVCPNCDRGNRGASGYGWCCYECELAAEAGKPAKHTDSCDARQEA